VAAVIESFAPAVPEAELDDLRTRLRGTRWPEPETHPDQGVALAELQDLCAYWADGYDWRRAEVRLNAIGQYRTAIDGLRIHFLHLRSPQADAFPLILTHGWPGSVIEFLDVLEPLTRAGFHCVVPSLPGYGWSDKPREPGWNIERIARAWASLMARLGYERYGALGSDWGTSVSASLGQQDSVHVAGVHLMPPLVPVDPATTTTSPIVSVPRSTRCGEAQSTTRATPSSSAPDHRPSGIRWPIRPRAWRPGSSRSWAAGQTLEVSSPATRSSTISCSTGCHERVPRRHGCTGRASAMSPAG
jgi:pimeloyl-ACP methyl ester carboxylesterase